MRKIFNIYFLAFVLSAFSFFAVGCDNIKPDIETIVSIRPRVIPALPYEGGDYTINVRTNQSDYQFEVTSDWVICERVAHDSLRITAAEYDGYGSRSAELVITAGVGDLRITKKYTILQSTKYSMAFDQEDVDDNGWLWLNTVNKINKYVGPDKLIKPKAALHGSLEATIYSDILAGADTLGVIEESDNSRLLGAIRLAKASSIAMVNDGGGIEIDVESCSNVELLLSSDATIRAGLYQSVGATGAFTVIKLYGGSFQPNLAAKGQFRWNAGAEASNAIIKSGKQTIRMVNMTNKYLYIHGIKLLY